MLQMINVDIKKTYYNDDLTDNEDFRRSQKVRKMLPDIKKENKLKVSKEKDVGNTSVDNAYLENDNQIKSKIVKIVKKKIVQDNK